MPEVGRPFISPTSAPALPYYPGPDHIWERRQPEAVGIDAPIVSPRAFCQLLPVWLGTAG
jgi:hypothetical protein